MLWEKKKNRRFWKNIHKMRNLLIDFFKLKMEENTVRFYLFRRKRNKKKERNKIKVVKFQNSSPCFVKR